MANYGPELLANADFELGDTGWTKVNSTISGGTGNLNQTGATSLLFQDVLTQGATYKIETDVSAWVDGTTRIKLDSGQTLYTVTGNGILTFEFTHPDINGNILWEASGVTGSMVLDNCSVKEVLSTTTIEVEWIDSISAAATGNKIYRDDVEIADIANGVQIYQDATAEIGTEYKYEVQAYSATDETTQEVLGVNVQYITTA